MTDVPEDRDATGVGRAHGRTPLNLLAAWPWFTRPFLLRRVSHFGEPQAAECRSIGPHGSYYDTLGHNKAFARGWANLPFLGQIPGWWP